MAIASALTSIIVMLVSFLVGFLAFYLISDSTKEQKKKQLDELASQLVNFIIYLWLAKILLKIPLFVKDPLAVLAYPSDSTSFYVAVLFSIIMIVVKRKRKNLDVHSLVNSFVPVFLVASFMFEFIQIVWYKDTYAVGYMGLLTLFVVILLLVRDRMSASKLNGFLMIGWSVSALVLALIMPIMTVFGFTIAPWFLGLIFVISVIYVFKGK